MVIIIMKHDSNATDAGVMGMSCKMCLKPDSIQPTGICVVSSVIQADSLPSACQSSTSTLESGKYLLWVQQV